MEKIRHWRECKKVPQKSFHHGSGQKQDQYGAGAGTKTKQKKKLNVKFMFLKHGRYIYGLELMSPCKFISS